MTVEHIAVILLLVEFGGGGGELSATLRSRHWEQSSVDLTGFDEEYIKVDGSCFTHIAD